MLLPSYSQYLSLTLNKGKTFSSFNIIKEQVVNPVSLLILFTAESIDSFILLFLKLNCTQADNLNP